MGFKEITGQDYTEDLIKRLKGEYPERAFLKQFREILQERLKPGSSMLDIGCATGYAYNSFKNSGITYTGLDIEEEYIRIASEYFRDNPQVNFIQHDTAMSASPKIADIVICSATLEHCSGLMPTLKHLTDAARHHILLRTFLGEREEIYSISSPISQYEKTHKKYYNQYSFKNVLSYLNQRGFKVRVCRDEFTDSMPQFLDGVIRTFFIIYATKS
ncbi:MAG: hypothetical protein FD145_43 [Candidatus Saganbacteria bacterium]|uniref:Class I SAM-dependent methyltransferase n=1 Tax=Candidatus Saganbacteria bacterium TaxID=2575572 RepID=A0A833L2E4_UNCSA|nr:MAG: hypothetical protein FD145_43 [Candidatus Saganbacteria bacterium]